MAGDTIRLNGVRWRLANEKGTGAPLYSQTPVPFFPPQVSQEEVTEAQFPPDARVPYSFRDLSGGSGQEETPITGKSTRYDGVGDTEGEGVDATLTPEGAVILAAELNTQADSSAGTAAYLGALWKGGSNTAYFAHGRYVNSWTGAAFANVGDLGAGNAATDALIAFRGTQSADVWYAPLGYATTPKYSTDSGVTWTAVTTSGGLDQVYSMTEIDGDVVVARSSRHGYGNAMVCSFNDGGSTPTIFGVIDPVGDPAFAITRLVSFAGRVYVLKDGEGVFLLTSSRRTLAEELFPELRGAKLYASAALVWRGLLWLPTDRGLYAIGPGNRLQWVGPESNEASNNRGNRGLVTAIAGDNYNLYGWRYAGSAQAAVLYKANVSITSEGIQAIKWHQFLQLATGAQCARMDVLSPGGNGPKLLLDLQTTGGLFNTYWLKLPSKGKDPRQDSAYRYCAAGTIWYSRLTARFPFANKSFFGITPLYDALTVASDGETATTAQSGRNRYKLDSTPLTGVSPFGYTQGAAQTSGAGTRDAIALRGRGLDVAHRLASSDNTTTPSLHSVSVEYDVEPNPLWQHEFTLEIGSGSTVSGGGTSPDPMTPGAAVYALRQLPASGSMPFEDLWDNTYDVTIPVAGIRFRPGGPTEEGRFREVPLLVDVRAIEQAAIASGTYAALGSFTYGALNDAGYTYASLMSL